MSEQLSRNAFRAAVLRGEQRPIIVAQKQPRLSGATDALEASLVGREKVRRSNHREADRHRLVEEQASLVQDGERRTVELINLSGGGAMVAADFPIRLWDIVELELGDGTPGLEAAVRWVKDGLVGLEFAHETRIDCAPEKRAELLLDVIKRSFPEADIELDLPEDYSGPAVSKSNEPGQRCQIRHPLVWMGRLRYGAENTPVRLRNISAGGALIDTQMLYPPGADVVLELGAAGEVSATVSWMRFEQAGLSFKEAFDLADLAKLRPDVTPARWTPPSFLQTVEEKPSPWSEDWGRGGLGDLKAELEGFLKR